MRIPKFISPYWAVLGTPVTWLGEKAWGDLWGKDGTPMNIPYLWLFAVSLAVAIGALWADVRNPRSEFRAWLAQRLKVFDVLACYINQESAPHEYFGIVCFMKFTKDIKNADLIIRHTNLHPTGNNTTVVYSEKVTAHKDQEKRILLASLPITRPGDAFARHALVGPELGGKDLMPNQHTFVWGPSIIEVRVNKQKYHVFLGELARTVSDPAPLFLVNEDNMRLYETA